MTVATKAVLEIEGVDKTAGALGAVEERMKLINKQNDHAAAKAKEGGGGKDILTRGFAMFTGLVFLRYAVKSFQELNASIDAPFHKAQEFSRDLQKNLFGSEAKLRIDAVSDAMKKMGQDLQDVQRWRKSANTGEDEVLRIMEAEETLAMRDNKREKEYLDIKQKQRAAQLAIKQDMNGELEVQEKLAQQRRAIGIMLKARGSGGEVGFKLDDRQREIETLLRRHKKGLAGASIIGPDAQSFLEKTLGMTVGSDMTKTLEDAIKIIDQVREVEGKNVEALNAEAAANERAAKISREKSAADEDSLKNLERLQAVELDIFAKNEYVKGLEDRKKYYDDLATAVRNASDESEGFFAGSSKWYRAINQGSKMGQAPYMKGYYPGMTQAPPQTQQQFTAGILKELGDSVKILGDIYSYLKQEGEKTI